MNLGIKNEWTRRLDSGEIPQGHGQLGKGAQRCCLGVLCDMAFEDGIVERREINGDLQYRRAGFVPTVQGDDGWEGGVLPHVVRVWAGLDSCNPEVTLETPYRNREAVLTQRVNLSSANDGLLDGMGNPLLRPHSFSEIAGLIRTNL